MAIVLDGKSLAKKFTDELAIEIKKYGAKPHLVVILVGDDPASEIYVRNKKAKAESTGIISTIINLPKEITETALLEKINELNFDNSVHAILVQLPLPEHICEKNVIAAISPSKDVDGFTYENSGRLLWGEKPFAYPCTPIGIIRILKEYNIEISGKNAVIIGRSNIVGKPLAIMLLEKNATVTVCHSRTKNLIEITKQADILISATGQKMITADMVKKGAAVIDVGIIRGENGKLSGDVDFDSVKEIAGFITPVPGGVGPMTIASLMENTVHLFLQQIKG